MIEGVLRSVHFGGAAAIASNLSFGSGAFDWEASMAHLVTSAPFRAGHLPVSGQLCEAAAEGGSPGAPVSCDLSACRHSLVGHPFPPWELVLPCGWLTGTNPDPDGVFTFRTARDPTGEGAL